MTSLIPFPAGLSMNCGGFLALFMTSAGSRRRRLSGSEVCLRFNRTFREEVLDQYLFRRLEDVREAAWWWMLEYNEQRPHDSLGDLTPAEVRQQYEESSTFALCA